MRKANRIITLVLLAAAAFFWLCGLAGAELLYSITPRYDNPSSWHMAHALPLAALACVGWVLVTWQEARGDGETRCRKCNYILRGLSEPRCPECGEPI